MRPYISSGISPSFADLVFLYAHGDNSILGNYSFSKNHHIRVNYLVQVEYPESRLVIL